MSRPRVYLHVGEPKTGSTYLQHVMWRNRATLLQTGILLPGPRARTHWRATQDLREVEQNPNDPIGSHAGMWDRLVKLALRAPRTAVISHELLAAVSEEQAQRALGSFGDAELHVILGVRDFATLLPAEWQESVKHRSTRGWTDWLRDVIDHEAGADNRRQFWFWRVHDTLEILRIWSAGLPPERVHVVTVPPRGSAPDLLWRRFAGIIGADHEGIDLEVATSNESLGVAEVELLRRINLQIPGELPDWFYMNTVKGLIAAQTLSQLADSERLELPADRRDWATAQSEHVTKALVASGYDIVGDLGDLMPAAARGTRGPADLSEGELLGPSLAVTNALLETMAESQGIRLGEDALSGEPSRLKRAAITLSHRSRTLHRVRRGYWHVANAMRRTRLGRSRAGA